METEQAPLVVDPADLGTALDVDVEVTARPGSPAVLRWQQAVGYGTGLLRHGYLDLAVRSFRSTLWAGPHRCLDHVEVAELETLACDPAGGRLLLRARTTQVALTRQGTLSLVPLTTGEAAGAALRRRGRMGRGQGPGDAP
jgi:hypothetical protein